MVNVALSRSVGLPDKKYDPKERASVNEAEIRGSDDYICLIALSKRLTSDKDKLKPEFCERVSKSRTLDKFMEFNYLYFFELSKVIKNRKAPDGMVPYEFFIDTTYSQQHI